MQYKTVTLLFTLILVPGLLLAGCTPAATAVPASPTPLTPPTATPVPLPALALRAGQFYFSLDGKPAFLFSRNLAGTQQTDYATLLGWSASGGSRFVRLQLDSLGMGQTANGGLDPNWAAQWDQIIDRAGADGIHVLLTFTAWYDWNAGSGYSTWKNNPLNQANGGPVKDPGELFQNGSATQTLWLDWMETLVKRWQGRKAILGWEIFSEVNLASGNTEAMGIDFVNAAAARIRAADASGRPVTASLADTGTWPNFYQKTNIDFINLHPYPPSGQLDRALVSQVRSSISRYNRPVLIGESGLSAETPDSDAGKLTVAPNAARGIRHAIWAGIVSGAMNGRALWWEDGVGIYFPALGFPWMEKYKAEEQPAVNFVAGVDFTDFQPLTASTTSGVWGAAIGNASTILGWFRDAKSEPPDWTLQPMIHGQTVSLTVPGDNPNWRVDFYDTRTGTTVLTSAFVTRKGGTLTIPLPDFQDDIAFKLSGGK